MRQLVKFLPLFFLYIIMIIAIPKVVEIANPLLKAGTFQHDELRYHTYAQNIIKGQYTDPANPDIQNAPGYPLYLSIFLKLGLPLMIPKLSNAILMMLAVFFFYKSSTFFISERISLVIAYILGLYYPLFRWIPYNITEAFSMFLLCAFIFYLLKAQQKKELSFSQIVLPAVFLSLLISTKFYYHYVVIITVILAIFLFLLRVGRAEMKKTILIMFLGYGLIAVPYLSYTYSLTGKTFFWTNQSGQMLYWMTTRYEDEYGKWFNYRELRRPYMPEIHESHYEFFDKILEQPYLAQDELILAKAKENIKNNPMDYFFNIVPNTLRLLFNYPYSYKTQSLNMYFYSLINTPIVLAFLLSLIPSWKFRKLIRIELVILMVFGLVYFGGLILIPAFPRYFFMLVPLLLLWCGYIYSNFVKIEMVNKVV